MDLQLLQRIASSASFYRTTHPFEIHQIALMRDAGLLVAFLPHVDRDRAMSHAFVLHVTPRGRGLLAAEPLPVSV